MAALIMVFSYKYPGMGISVTIKNLRSVSSSFDVQTGKIEYTLVSIYGDEDILLLPVTVSTAIGKES